MLMFIRASRHTPFGFPPWPFGFPPYAVRFPALAVWFPALAQRWQEGADSLAMSDGFGWDNRSPQGLTSY
jgi:hypothetical protein